MYHHNKWELSPYNLIDEDFIDAPLTFSMKL